MAINDDHANELRALCLDDSLPDAELIRETLLQLHQNLTFHFVDSREKYEDSLRNHSYDVILADYNVPGFQAPDALESAHAICPDVPFICISGAIEEKDAVDFVKQGATDYVMKDKLYRLEPAIVRAVNESKLQNEREKAIKALKESQIMFSGIVNTSPGMIWISDLQLSRTWFNDVWLQFRGRSLEEEKDDGWQQGIHPDDLSFVLITYKQALENKHAFLLEYRIRKYTGEYVWVVDRGNPLYNAEGNVTGLINSSLEMSARKVKDHKHKHFMRLYNLLSELMTVTLSIPKPQELYDKICTMLMNASQTKLACIVEFNYRTRQYLVIAKRGGDNNYLSNLETLLNSSHIPLCPIHRVFQTNAHEICYYLSIQAPASECQCIAYNQDIRTVSAFPILKGGQAIAALVLYSEQEDYFNNDTVHLYDEVVKNIELALDYSTRIHNHVKAYQDGVIQDSNT